MAVHVSHAALPFPVKKARYSFMVPFLDADGDPTDPTTPDTEVSKDAGAFADCAEEVTTISGSNGSGLMTLSGAEMDASLVAVAAKVASGPKATLLEIRPRVLPICETGTAAAGAAGSLTLASGAKAIDDYYVGCIIRTTGGTGGGGTGGANNQARIITDYVGSTKVASVEPNWETTPDATTTYDILHTELSLLKYSDLQAWRGSQPNTLTSGRVEVLVGAVTAGVIAAASFAASALDAVWSTATRTLTAASDSSGVTTLLSRLSVARAGYLDNLSGGAAALESSLQGLITTIGASAAGVATAVWSAVARTLTAATNITSTGGTTVPQTGDAYAVVNSGTFGNAALKTLIDAVKAVVDAIKGKTDNLPADPADASDIASAFSAVNSTLTTIAAYIDTEIATLLSRLGAWTGTGRNTVLGAFQALFRKDADATVPSDVNANLGGGAGAAANTTDSLEAIRDRGDAAWATPDVSALALETTAQSAKTAAEAAQTAAEAVDARLPSDPADQSLVIAATNALSSAIAALATAVGDLPTNGELAIVIAAADDAVLAAIAALNNLSQANVRAALGMASPNLDAQLDALPTNADLATALAAADDAVLAAIAALNNLSAAQVNAQVVDALATDTYPEPAAVPAATASLTDKINWLAALARNRITQTSSTQTLRNDANSGDIATAAVSDDGTTFVRAEWT